jgi:DNA-binding winged helix-turn-helix (wHTH) protein
VSTGRRSVRSSCRNPDAFSRTELCERIWQREHEYDTRTVEIYIARLRKKVDAVFDAPLIHTLRYVGYAIGPSTPRRCWRRRVPPARARLRNSTAKK